MALHPIESLAIQQKRVLELLVEGLGNVQIAQRNRVPLEKVAGILDELYTTLGIETSLSRQEKRTIAINHFKKSTGVLSIFEQRTPAALLEGFKPWHRKALNLIAQEKSSEDVASEVGLSSTVIEKTFSEFMALANISTRDQAIVVLRQVIGAISEPIVSERGYENGHNKVRSPTMSAKSNAPLHHVSEGPTVSVVPKQESIPATATAVHEVSHEPAFPLVREIPRREVLDITMSSKEKPMSALAATAKQEKAMFHVDQPVGRTAAKEVAPLPERINKYMEMRGITITQFADHSGLSSATIYKILKGVKVRDAGIKRVEAVLAGKSFSASDTSDTEYTFDTTCERLIAMVSDLASGQNELDELVRLVFNRWSKVEGAEETKAFAVNILRQYLITETEETRLEALLELRDLMKQTPKNSA